MEPDSTRDRIKEFITHARNNNIDSCEYLIDTDNNSISKDLALVNCLKLRYFKVCSWLIHKKNATIYNYYEDLSKFCVSHDVSYAIQIYSWIQQTHPVLIDRTHLISVFLHCCTRGNLYFAQWLYDNFTINLSYNSSIFFKGAVLFGHLSIVKWLYSLSQNTGEFIMWSAIHACQEGHLSILKWICEESLLEINIHEDQEYLLRIAIIYKRFDIIRYLIETCKANPLDIHNIEIDDFGTSSDNEAIELACRTGNIDIIRYIIQYYDTHRPSWNIHENDDFIFIISCMSSSLDIVKYLYHIKSDSFHTMRLQYCFKEIILNNYSIHTDYSTESEKLLILDWLWTKSFPNDLEVKKSIDMIQNIFISLCELPDPFIPKIKWLMNKCPMIDIHYNEELAFITACQLGRYNTARFLYSQASLTNDPINIRSKQDSAFHFAIKGYHYNIAQWLSEITDSYIVIYKETDNLISFEIENDEDEFYDNKEWNKLSSFYNMRQCIIPDPLANSIQKTNFKKTCSICLDQCRSNACVMTSCDHWFCIPDFFEWITNRNRRECPMCRQRIQLNTSTIYLQH